jgi:hypothetical protein
MDHSTYGGHDEDEADDMGGEEEVVGFLSPVLGREENDNVEANDSDSAPDGKGELYRLGERPFQRPFIN